jgi:hypothetical protein
VTTEFKVVVRYWQERFGYQERSYVVRAGDARVAATKGLKLFAMASSYTGPLYRRLTLRPDQVLTVSVTR